MMAQFNVFVSLHVLVSPWTSCLASFLYQSVVVAQQTSCSAPSDLAYLDLNPLISVFRSSAAVIVMI